MITIKFEKLFERNYKIVEQSGTDRGVYLWDDSDYTTRVVSCGYPEYKYENGMHKLFIRGRCRERDHWGIVISYELLKEILQRWSSVEDVIAFIDDEMITSKAAINIGSL